MIETMESETPTDAADEAVIDPPFNPETLATGRCECYVCGSTIPPLSVQVTPSGGFNAAGVARARRVDLLCPHCDTAFELQQVRRDGEWVTTSASTLDVCGRNRVARDLSNQQATTYVDRPAADPSDSARLVLIARLDREIARHEERAAEARQARAELMGVTAAESAALRVGGFAAGSQFPYVSGDVRHLIGDASEDQPWSHG